MRLYLRRNGNEAQDTALTVNSMFYVVKDGETFDPLKNLTDSAYNIIPFQNSGYEYVQTQTFAGMFRNTYHGLTSNTILPAGNYKVYHVFYMAHNGTPSQISR
jgi:hypothetical protein